MARYETAELTGKTFGTWKVLAFDGVVVTSTRGGAGGKGRGPAKRAMWFCECIICETRKTIDTSTLTKQPPTLHRPCRRKFNQHVREEIKRDAAAIFGVSI